MEMEIMLSAKDEEDMLPGFRFHPTDEELVGFYLRRKVEKKPTRIELIKQVDIYKYDPWDLPGSCAGEKEGYFFCIRGRKYRNSIRPNRVTKSGFWKATGIDKPIYSAREPHECIGLKKSLVYYRGSAGKGTKTDWMMHEFRLPPPPAKNASQTPLHAKINVAQEAEVWTLCRIFKRIPSYRKYTPEWNKDSITKTDHLGDSSSKTCSLESDNSDQIFTFGDSCMQNNDHKSVIKHDINVVNKTLNSISQMNTMIQPSQMASYSSFYHPNGDAFFDNGNWDELGSVVELANGSGSIPSTRVYGCI